MNNDASFPMHAQTPLLDEQLVEKACKRRMGVILQSMEIGQPDYM